MKILHCCLAAFYIDNFGYQENILPKMHKLQGHDVHIIASTETYSNQHKLEYLEPISYFTSEGIPIKRIPYLKGLPHMLVRKLRIYCGLFDSIKQIKPDIIFIHDCQFISIKEIAKYIKQHSEVKVFVDSHTDFINSGKNWISKNIFHRIIYKWCAKKIEPYTEKFYGTLPLRVNFYREVYDLPAHKIELLVMGADQTIIDLNKRENIREEVRKNIGLHENDFIVLTGGKIEQRKNIQNLLAAFNKFEKADLKLIIFGTPTEDLKHIFNDYRNNKNISILNWLEYKEIFKYMLAADLAIFPGTHSVLWEQAVGLGMPCVFRKWEGIQHVDLDGNCIFIDEGTIEEIYNAIYLLYSNRSKFLELKRNALLKGIKEFSYYEIAKKAIKVN